MLEELNSNLPSSPTVSFPDQHVYLPFRRSWFPSPPVLIITLLSVLTTLQKHREIHLKNFTCLKFIREKGWLIYDHLSLLPSLTFHLLWICSSKIVLINLSWKVLFSPRKVLIYRSVHGVLILHLFGSQLFFSFPFICFCLTGSVRSKTHLSTSHKSPSRPYQQIITLRKQEKALALLEHRLSYQTRCLYQLLLATTSLLANSEEVGRGRNKRLEKQKVSHFTLHSMLGLNRQKTD